MFEITIVNGKCVLMSIYNEQPLEIVMHSSLGNLPFERIIELNQYDFKCDLFAFKMKRHLILIVRQTVVIKQWLH